MAACALAVFTPENVSNVAEFKKVSLDLFLTCSHVFSSPLFILFSSFLSFPFASLLLSRTAIPSIILSALPPR